MSRRGSPAAGLTERSALNELRNSASIEFTKAAGEVQEAMAHSRQPSILSIPTQSPKPAPMSWDRPGFGARERHRGVGEPAKGCHTGDRLCDETQLNPHYLSG